MLSSSVVTAIALSDKGAFRQNNEDAYACLEDIGFFALADGMGGHNAGEVAAQEAISFYKDSIDEFFLCFEGKWSIEDVALMNRVIISDVNAWVHKLSLSKPELKGMGTTLCSILFYGSYAILSNVGDSRVYRYRNNLLTQLSFDHSLENALKLQGKESSGKQKNILTMAIGTHLDVNPQIEVVKPDPNDIYLLCSDGLSDYLPIEKMNSLIDPLTPLSSTAALLIEEAKSAGSTDNITLILVHFNE